MVALKFGNRSMMNRNGGLPRYNQPHPSTISLNAIILSMYLRGNLDESRQLSAVLVDATRTQFVTLQMLPATM